MISRLLTLSIGCAAATFLLGGCGVTTAGQPAVGSFLPAGLQPTGQPRICTGPQCGLQTKHGPPVISEKYLMPHANGSVGYPSPYLLPLPRTVVTIERFGTDTSFRLTLKQKESSRVRLLQKCRERRR